MKRSRKAKYQIRYKRTKFGLITIIYGCQTQAGKLTPFKKLEYTKEWFSIWLFNQEQFHILYDNWVKSYYDLDFRPSVDRINPLIGYTKDNIQIITYKENIDKGRIDIKIHAKAKRDINDASLKHYIPRKNATAVAKYDENWNFIRSYASASNAAKDIGVSRQCICAILRMGYGSKIKGFQISTLKEYLINKK